MVRARVGAPQGRPHLAHLATQRPPPARLPLRRSGASGSATRGTQRVAVGATQQLQRGLAGRTIAHGPRGRFLQCQQAAAEWRAARLYRALPTIVGALGAWEGSVLLRPKAHHASPAVAVAAVRAHGLPGRVLAQSAGGLGGTSRERQGCGGSGARRERVRGSGLQPRTQSKTAAVTAAAEATQGTRAGRVLEAARSERGPGGGAVRAGSWQLCSPTNKGFWLLRAPLFCE